MFFGAAYKLFCDCCDICSAYKPLDSINSLEPKVSLLPCFKGNGSIRLHSILGYSLVTISHPM